MTRIAIFGPLGAHDGGRGVGGVATHTVRVATALAAAGHDVAVIADDAAGVPGVAVSAPWGALFGTLDTHTSAFASVAPTFLRSGARCAFDPRRTNLDLRLARCLKRSTLLACALKAFRPDVLHVQQPDYRPLYADWSGTDVPTLLCAHGGTGALWTHSHPGLDAVVPENLRRADAIVTPSHFLAKEVARLAPGAVEAAVVANGVDTELFRPRDRATCRERTGIDPQVPLVVFAGRITEAKGVFDLLGALDAVRDRLPETLCALVGPIAAGEAELSIPELRDDPASQTFAVPPTDQETVATWLGASDVVVVPSHYEGFGLAALEAMASSRPVVASAVGGLCDLVDGTVGQLVPPEDSSKLAEAIERLLIEPESATALGSAGRVRAESFTWSATAAGFSAAYDRLFAAASR